MQERAATDDDEAAAAADMNERGERKQKRFGEEVVQQQAAEQAGGGRKERGTDGSWTVNWRMAGSSSAVGDPLSSFLPLSDKNQRRAMIRKSALQRKMGGGLKASFPSTLSQHPPVSSEEHMKSSIKLFCML